MPSPRRPLPRGLHGVAFTVSQGRSIGLGQTRMRGSDLARPFRGIRVGGAADLDRLPAPEVGSPAAHDPGRRGALDLGGGKRAASGIDRTAAPDQDLVDRCSALGVALPHGAFFSHLTAARLWPLPLPQSPRNEPIHVSVRRPARPPRRSGVAGHLVTDPLVSKVWRHGFPMADPATVFCELAGVLSLPDLVAVGDALALQPVFADSSDDRPWVTLRQLQERVELFRERGKKTAGRAVGLIRPGAESRPETLVRLAIKDAGLPEPEVNVDIRDARGRFVGRGDLVYRRWRVIVEYDGEQHRTDTKQFDRDVRRLEEFAANGWQVIRIVGRSFFGDRAECMDRIRRALLDGGWRP